MTTFPVIVGPCVIDDATTEIAAGVAALAAKHKLQVIFKASFDKANRTSHRSYRGPGLAKGLAVLDDIKQRYGLPVTTDVHETWQAAEAAQVCDLIQIPALLCRQTDLVQAAGRTGKPVNVKKGQFLAPRDVEHIAAKLRAVNCADFYITERGTTFGYGDLVVDLRGMVAMRRSGYRVIFDASHSCQAPAGRGHESGGDAGLILPLSRAALACGCDGLFVEVHSDPAAAKSDRDTCLSLTYLDLYLTQCLRLRDHLRDEAPAVECTLPA